MILCEKNGVSYRLDKINHTAQIIKSPNSSGSLLILQSLQYQSQEYIITSIGEDSFQENKSINSILFTPNSSISIIGRNAFESTLIEKISIPDSVVQIEEYSFIWCKLLKVINISEKSNLQSIGPRAFVDTLIENLYFPSKLEKLEKGWCDRTNSLKIINVSPQNTNFKFINNQYLLGKSEILYFARRDIVSITIPSQVKEISPFAFDNCTNLQSIIFSENSELQTIGDDAFRNCTSLKTIKIPSTVQTIEHESFYNCIDLKTVIFGENSKLQKIGTNSFHGCPFDTFSVPQTVTQVESFSFSFCQNLTLFLFPKNSRLRSISSNVFLKSGLNSIVFPSYISVFGNSAFSECKKLKFAEFLGENLIFEKNFFKECDHLYVVSFPNSVKVEFGSNCFRKVANNCRVFFNVFTVIEQEYK